MEQTKNVKSYGDITFIFNKTLEETLALINEVEVDESYTSVVYSPDEIADKEDRMKELEEFKEYVRGIYMDCSILATEEAINKKYSKKKNGKFRKGATAHYKTGENFGLYDTEFTNSWNTLVVIGKAISEKEIEVKIELKWLTN